MKITKSQVQVLHALADEQLVDVQPKAGGMRGFVTLKMMTDEGIEGIGLTFVPAMGLSPLLPALKSAVDALCGLAEGQDPTDIEAVMQGLRQKTIGSGPGGILTLALAAVDMALWDIKGKAVNQSVCSLLGGYRKRVPAYASGALMRPMNLEQLAEIGPALVEKGFRQMKSQMGGEDTPAKEVMRMRTLREAVGEDIDIMCDINELWNVNQAIGIGRQVEEYHLFWLEDVVAHDDYQGMARVADALTTPLAAGEYVYGINPHRQLIENRSVDIVMIDLLRVGGITEWRKVAGMAEAFNLPVVSHLVPEIHIQLMGSIPNGLTVEYMPWTLKLFEETPKFVDGCLEVPDKPGLGLNFSQDAFKQYSA
ncbi:MAG: mandelate racemase/muconate lactonizing enzyme family protein [Chloroflexi bacterium]|nr:mandelate racemase/muconate lactonizing enzyme family protein [Chloroflexota bacterium]